MDTTRHIPASIAADGNAQLSGSSLATLVAGDILTLRNPSALSAILGSELSPNSQAALFRITKVSDSYSA